MGAGRGSAVHLADNPNPRAHLRVTGTAVGEIGSIRPPGATLTDDANNLAPDAVWVADHAWLGGPTLRADVVIESRDGIITRVSTDDVTPPRAQRLRGMVLPGLANAHSHAFHRALRGTTHRQGGDFWLWRERMYEVASALTPEGYERLATAVFVEMALAGITTVGEFHYLHHQPGGTPYADPNEMGHALVRAARTAGVNIALLDAGYFSAGFDDTPLDAVQMRFSDESPASWLDRVESLRGQYEGEDDVVIGLAPHSVRAVPESGLAEVARRAETMIHVHVSEQRVENEACLEATGATPTGLLERAGVLGPDTTLVHATHVNAADIETIGSSGSAVCYCATTERDLADGIGPAERLARSGTSLCVGSDSHAVIDLFEEARGIELHTRLATGRRGVFAPHELLWAATGNGLRSLGFGGGGIEVGASADLIVVDPDSPRLAGLRPENAVDTVVFAATAADVTDVFVAGRQVVKDRRHEAWAHARGALDLPTPGR